MEFREKCKEEKMHFVKQNVRVVGEEDGSGKAGRAAGSLRRHTLLSKQLSSQGRVAAGHGGITLLANKRELHSLKAMHDSPMTSQQL